MKSYLTKYVIKDSQSVELLVILKKVVTHVSVAETPRKTLRTLKVTFFRRKARFFGFYDPNFCHVKKLYRKNTKNLTKK